jgi:ribosomal protein S18 acetylase RimI-like enzyme
MSAKPPAVRIARPEDAGRISALWRTFLRDTGVDNGEPLPARHFRGLLGKPDQLWIVAGTAGTVCGFARARLSTDDDGVKVDPYVEIMTLVVARPHRRHGLGRALVRAVEKWARSRRAGALRLVVHDSNAGAISLYERSGFTTWMRMMECRLPPLRRR